MPHQGKQCYLACTLALLIGAVCGCGNSLSYSSTIQISPNSAVLSPGQKLQFTAIVHIPNSPQSFEWQVNGVVGGSAANGTIATNGVYTAPSSSATQPLRIGVRDQPAVATVYILDPSHPLPGSVATTQNPLVAEYTIPILPGASAQVQFGTDTSYGFTTSAMPAPVAGGVVTVLVAGMRASTTYHMQAVVHMPDGTQYTDTDHTFTTGAIPSDRLPPNINSYFTGAGMPSPGIELLSLALDTNGVQNLLCAVATDLSGNVVWYYDLPAGTSVTPIKPLPNGHMLLLTAGVLNDVREIDLAGNLIHQITMSEINQSLAAAGSFQITGLSHDVLALPNGHFILLADLSETTTTALPGLPEGTVVTANGLIDWDLQKGAVWTWSAYDHLDLTHAPYGYPDWIHANAVIYSPDDGDLIFSMRDQNWIIKINYQDGTGDGSILWRFGPDGDFTLAGQEAPLEWNYGQHDPTIQSPNSSGIFSMMFFNNGNSRVIGSNVCSSPGIPPCYSSVPIFQLNEYTKTASLIWEDNLTDAFSECCGDARAEPNGNVEFDVADDINLKVGNTSYIEEVTQTSTPELVWRMTISGQLAYRGFRIPSLYPGEVWPAYAQQNQRAADAHH